MAEVNKRYIDIDTDTRVGFNYIKQKYYVTNKEYTTYRSSITEIMKVLTALNIDSITDVEIRALSDSTEDLYKVYYTLHDTGAYIHTIQFNDFADYPLTIDCEKHKLYIMNSTIIYDLTLNESPRNIRIPRILSFYKNTLGLLISTQDMCYFYSLLLSNYYPTCYNQVTYNEETNACFYNNKFLLSNYSNTSDATYICTYNPNNDAVNTKVGNVVATNTTDNTITLSQPITMEDLQYYNKVIVQGTTTELEGSTYSADGEYTITHMGDNVLKVDETVAFTYEFPYKECYVNSADYTVLKMERTTRQISVSNAPTDILVGDIIIVSGATVTSEYETISCNGSYTVESVSENTIVGEEETITEYIITVEEEIPTDFVGEAILIKELFISNISKIEDNVITLIDETDLDLTGATIFVHTIADGETSIENYEVASFTSSTITVIGEISNYDYITTCPQLLIPVPDMTQDAEVLIDVTSVSENAEEVFPTGEFMVDNFQQCHDYLNTLAGLVTPTNENKSNLYKKLDNEIPLEEIPDLTTATSTDRINCSLSNMTFKGLYSKNYTE